MGDVKTEKRNSIIVKDNSKEEPIKMLLLLVYMLVPVTNMFRLLPPGLNRRTYDKHQVSITTVLSMNVCKIEGE